MHVYMPADLIYYLSSWDGSQVVILDSRNIYTLALFNFFFKFWIGAGEMSQLLGVLAALAEGQGSIFSTFTVTHNCS